MTIELIACLQREERALLHHHGVRLRVDKVTANGRNALCSIRQVSRPFFRRALCAYAMADLAHVALRHLHLIDLKPLIAVVPNDPGHAFTALERKDPFLLHAALCAAGREDMLLPGQWTVAAFMPEHRFEGVKEIVAVA